MKQYVLLFLKGLAMGAANVIPGVSGGTIALITGIYEELINSVKSIDIQAFKMLLGFRFRAFWAYVNGNFLLAVFAGIGLSILTLAKLFKFMLEHETYALWLMAFFFGLILVSVFSVARTVHKWTASAIIALVLGFIAALLIALVNPASENDGLLYLFICGVIAMCSMILPGLSGSFVLIILGNYKLVMLDAVSDFRLNILIPVGIGAVVGLLAFSRLLAWVFKHYRDVTIALMTGFILGSLSIIWPWKQEEYLLDPSGELILKKGQPVISGYDWFLPDLSDAHTLAAIAIMLLGAASLWGIERFAHKLST
ncbi:MAG: DUF368 domain-containing protein [Bacteroidetes bacterium]|nr:MAG: DUF368 domain-containing protein [Bacteroidota bacterium]